MDRYRYYQLIPSVMLATDSIDLWVKKFSFLTDIIDYRSEKKIFSSIKSNHRLKIFFSSKDHRSNRCFLQLIDYRYRSNRCFFRHRCPSMGYWRPPIYDFLHDCPFKGLGSLDLTLHHAAVRYDSPLHHAAVRFDSPLHHAAERFDSLFQSAGARFDLTPGCKMQ